MCSYRSPIRFVMNCLCSSPVYVFGGYPGETGTHPPPPLLVEGGLPRVMYLRCLGQGELWGWPHEGEVQSGDGRVKSVNQRVPIHFWGNWNQNQIKCVQITKRSDDLTVTLMPDHIAWRKIPGDSGTMFSSGKVWFRFRDRDNGSMEELGL